MSRICRLRSGNDSLEVSIVGAPEFAFPLLSCALDATLLLVQLFLSADPLSLAFFHTVCLSSGLNSRSLKIKVRRVRFNAGPYCYLVNTEATRVSSPRSPTVAASICSAAAPIPVSETRFARSGFVYLDILAFEFGIVESPDRIGNLWRGCHLDKAEAPRLSGEFIRDHGGAFHLTC